MLRRTEGIGLDIENGKIKLLQVKKKRDQVLVKCFGSIETDEGMVQNGLIQDPIGLGKRIALLVNELDLHGKKVVSAAAGQQIFLRNIILPEMPEAELRQAVYYQARLFLPVSVEDTFMDIYPLRNFEDKDGHKTELFMAAVKRQHISNLEEACRIAGLKLSVVDIEPLAIYRAIKEADDQVLKAILYIGDSRAYFMVFEAYVLSYYRVLSFTGSALEDDLFSEKFSDLQAAGLEYLIKELTSEISRSMEYYSIQSNNKIEYLYACGSITGINEFNKSLSDVLGLQVKRVDILSRIYFENSVGEAENKNCLQNDYLVALGLAIRGIV